MSNAPEHKHSDAHAHDPNDPHFKKHLKLCIGVFVALLFLTGVTVGASYINLGHGGNIILALVIATIKASMVAAIFMHLMGERPMIFKVLVFTGIFVIGLMFLTLFNFADGVDEDNVRAAQPAASQPATK